MGLVALAAALMCAFAQVSFKVGPVPYTMQNAGVVLAGLLLDPADAATSMLVYLLLIALGAPVAAGLRGGLAVLLGYTGGYLLGFVPSAFLMSVLSRLYLRGRGLDSANRRDLLVLLALSAVAVTPTYLLGFLVFSLYAVPGSKLYAWASGVAGWLGLGGAPGWLVLFVASVAVFVPQDLLMDHVVAVLAAREVARLLKARGIRVG